MAQNRSPLGITVNGALLQVRDPNAKSGAWFQTYRRVPGLGSFTLPAEAGTTNETALMDGTVGAAAFKGVGTITGAIGALGVHATHLFLEERSLNGEDIQVNIIRLATKVKDILIAKGGSVDVVDVSEDKSKIIVPSANRDDVKSSVRAGCLILLGAPASSPAALDKDSVVDYDDAVSGANDLNWQVCQEVEDDGSEIIVAPGFSADKATTSSNGIMLQVRNPGRTYTDILCTVNQFDAGDFQNASNVAGNISLTPSVALPRVRVEGRIDLS